MDVSDGLVGDFGKLCAASKVSARVDVSRVPLSAAARKAVVAEPALIQTVLTSGDDYEIVAAVPPKRLAALRCAAAKAGIPLAEIGEIEKGRAEPAFLGRDGQTDAVQTTLVQSFLSGQGDQSMDDRTGATKIVTASDERAYQGGSPLRRRFPTIDYLRRGSRRHAPYFAYEYSDGGAGSDKGIARNWAALDAVELVPRYGVMPSLPPCDVELFGRRYAAPVGVPPMGGPALVWPGADMFLAQAAQKARIPYVLGMVGGLTIEQAAAVAPDVLWFQLYRMAKNNHAYGFDIMRRAEEAGVHVFVMTMDVPVRTTRPREVAVGLGGGKFSPDLRMIVDMLRSPGWLRTLARNGRPKFPNLMRYAGENADINKVIAFARNEMGGAFTWDEIARFRDKWKKPMVVKGILHPADAEKAVSLGIDGVWVSNHGGRQIEALPASIDVLPAIAAQVGSRATVLFDSGVRSGTDVVRALALGAKACFCRQGVPVGPWRARRCRPSAHDRPADRRNPGRAWPDRGAQPRRRPFRRDPPPGGAGLSEGMTPLGAL